MTVATRTVRVVLVDDSPFDRRLMAHWLADDGSCLIVGEADDGVDAARVAAGARPDVVVLDLMMPNVGGIEAIDDVARAVPHARIVVTSSGDDDFVRREAAARGARYVSKDAPFALRRAVLGDDPAPFVPGDPSFYGLWSTLRNLPMPVAVCGAGDRVLRLNEFLCELVGAPPVRLLDRSCEAFLAPEDDNGRERALHDELWSGRRASYSALRTVRRADGSERRVVTRWWAVDDARFWHEDGSPAVIVVAFDDSPRAAC